MCGIAGFLDFADSASGSVSDIADLKLMGELLRNRGPEALNSIAIPPFFGVHTHLKVVNQAENNKQPFQSDHSPHILLFNGEIYNYESLREELRIQEHVRFITNTDTEVLYQGLVHQGLKFLDRLDGDFAFAFYDPESSFLYLGRDRLGIKPLYFSIKKNRIMFASEMKPLIKVSGNGGINVETLSKASIYRYPQFNDSIFNGLNAVRPGTYLRFDSCGHKTETIYYNLVEHIMLSKSTQTSVKDYSSELFNQIDSSISNQSKGLSSKVCFLSGGVDSTLIALGLDDPEKTKYLTFSLGLNDFDTQSALKFCDKNSLRHDLVEPIGMTEETLKISILSLEDPCLDSIIHPTDLLFRRAALESKVVLTGDGADEIFSGYIHHKLALYSEKVLFKTLMKMPWKPFYGVGKNVLQSLSPYPRPLDSSFVERLEHFNKSKRLEEKYYAVAHLFSFEETAELLGSSPEDYLCAENLSSAGLSVFEYFYLRDLLSWLPRYVLNRLDRLSMFWGVEARVPYLHHKIVEIAGALLFNSCGNKQLNKFWLRNYAISKKFSTISKVKKKSFVQPLPNIGRSTLANNVLAKTRIAKLGMLNTYTISKILNEKESFLKEKRIFALISLQLWGEEFCE